MNENFTHFMYSHDQMAKGENENEEVIHSISDSELRRIVSTIKLLQDENKILRGKFNEMARHHNSLQDQVQQLTAKLTGITQNIRGIM